MTLGPGFDSEVRRCRVRPDINRHRGQDTFPPQTRTFQGDAPDHSVPDLETKWLKMDGTYKLLHFQLLRNKRAILSISE